MDADLDLDSDDAIYLLRHVLKPSSYPIKQNGDVDGNNVVNNDDAIYLLRHIFDAAKYPLVGD